ncbi:hypothetical protein HMPREF1549_01217 [Actinomyces johnsonii F0510]|uniref:Uncharacterized protein n=1 Tax=Actinomyces johnsonii F0510 TaxID=1227262 RepID=U1RPT8_9ACTO|nr:hypothetical protein HMPREF1549_01217 [Actinomyces johnsonii F0510]
MPAARPEAVESLARRRPYPDDAPSSGKATTRDRSMRQTPRRSTTQHVPRSTEHQHHDVA